jgi:hypothetical protein
LIRAVSIITELLRLCWGKCPDSFPQATTQ